MATVSPPGPGFAPKSDIDQFIATIGTKSKADIVDFLQTCMHRIRDLEATNKVLALTNRELAASSRSPMRAHYELFNRSRFK
jgi:hypothetical protein